jgi:hypothetical protein
VDNTIRESLIASFMALGLTRAEAEIAADGGATNPANGTNNARDIGEILEPIGRGGYREF